MLLFSLRPESGREGLNLVIGFVVKMFRNSNVLRLPNFDNIPQKYLAGVISRSRVISRTNLKPALVPRWAKKNSNVLIMKKGRLSNGHRPLIINIGKYLYFFFNNFGIISIHTEISK